MAFRQEIRVLKALSHTPLGELKYNSHKEKNATLLSTLAALSTSFLKPFIWKKE